MDKSSVQTTLSAAETYIASPTAYAGQLLAVTNDSTDNNGAYVVKVGSGSSLYLEKIGAGSGNADAPIVHRVINNSATLSLPTTGDDYLLLPNNSYIYEVALNSLSLNLSAITGGTTNTDNYSGYFCIVYFQTSASMTTFTVTNNSASYTFGDYTVNSGTYTFNVLPSTPYIFTVKDNVVICPGSFLIIYCSSYMTFKRQTKLFFMYPEIIPGSFAVRRGMLHFYIICCECIRVFRQLKGFL